MTQEGNTRHDTFKEVQVVKDNLKITLKEGTQIREQHVGSVRQIKLGKLAVDDHVR